MNSNEFYIWTLKKKDKTGIFFVLFITLKYNHHPHLNLNNTVYKHS